MKKQSVMTGTAVLAAVLGAASLTACGGGGAASVPASTAVAAETETSAEEKTEAEQAFAGAAETSSWKPEKSVEIVVPFSAGGSSDLLARAVEAVWSKYCDQPLVITCTPGGGGVTGAMSVATADPDGYKLELGYGSGHDMSMGYLQKLDYDPFTMLEPVCMLSEHTVMICTTADSEYESLGDMVEWQKTSGQPITASVSTANGTQDLAVQGLRYATGIDMKIVPHDGGSKAVADLLSGAYMLSSGHPTELLSYVQSGQVKILGVAAEERDPSMPDVPTLKEQGIDFATYGALKGIAVPAGTPKEIKAYYEELFRQISEDEQYQEILANMCQPNMYKNTEEFTEYFKEANTFYGKLIEDMGLTYKE